MPNMSEKLAAHYGAAAQPGADTVKIAQMEYFAKLAAAEGIDLRHCTQEQIDRAWDAVFGAKEASEGAPVEEEVPVKEASAEEELAAARAEFERIKEARAQEAQSDMLGKVIAHSLIAELAKMAADGKLPPGFGGKKKDGDGDGESGEGDGDGDSEKPDGEKDASALGTAMRAEKALHGAAAKARSAAGAAGHAAKNPGATAERVGKKLTEKATGVGTSNMKPSHAKGVAAGVAAAGAGAAGGAAAAAKKLRGEKKEGSALDLPAAEIAIKIAAQEGFDIDEAADLMNALLVLGPAESAKVASAPSMEAALVDRAWELLEQAGYPVVWQEPTA